MEEWPLQPNMAALRQSPSGKLPEGVQKKMATAQIQFCSAGLQAALVNFFPGVFRAGF